MKKRSVRQVGNLQEWDRDVVSHCR